MQIKKGDLLSINNEKCEVLTLNEDIDKFDSKNDKLIGEHTAVNLHKIGNKALHPTHLLKIYKDTKIVLLTITHKKPPEWLEKPRQRGQIFTYSDETKIPVENIKVE